MSVPWFFTSTEKDITLSGNLHFYFPLLRHFYSIIYKKEQEYIVDVLMEWIKREIISYDFKKTGIF